MVVKDIMVKDVSVLSADMPADKGLRLILEEERSGLPVVDKNNNLVGMLTEKEILKFCLPSYLDKVGAFVYERNPKAVLGKLAKLKDLKVSDVMRKDVITVSEDATLSEVSKIILTQQARRIPVVKDKKIIGIIARADIVRHLAEEAGLT
jgi:CBS domain-containing protein